MPIVKFTGPEQIVSHPGTVVQIYGHNFVVQPNGEAYADVAEAFIATEIAAGRYQLLQPVSNDLIEPEPEPILELKPEPETESVIHERKIVESEKTFPLEGSPTDFFGTGSLNALNEKLRTLRKQDLVTICHSLKLGTPAEMGKSTMVMKICAAVAQIAKA